MRYGRTVAGLRADVKRLEKATAKGGRPCACCLLHRLSGPVLRSGEPPPPAEEALVIPCEFCGRGRVYDVTGRPDYVRQFAALLHAPVEARYTDPRVDALYWWIIYAV